MSAVLRAMAEADLERVLRWRNRDEVRVNMYTTHVIDAAEHRAWWRRESANEQTRLLICEIDGVPEGFVSFTRYSGPGGAASWAFYAGDSGRRGVGAAMERAALEHAFGALQLRRLECEVLDFNSRVIAFHRRHGFRVEGRRRQAYARDGEFHDIVQLAILAEDWFARVRPSLGRPRAESWAGRAHTSQVTFAAEAVDQYARASGDNNPLHLDAAEARAAGFADRIVQGMLAGGAISRVFAQEFPGPGTVYVSQSLTFQRPILAGQIGNVEFNVISHIARRLEVETVIRVDGAVCVSGEAVVQLPRKR